MKARQFKRTNTQRLPSIKTLDAAFPGKGKELRLALESIAYCDSLPVVQDLIRSCYHRPSTSHRRMVALDSIAETMGVEYIAEGEGSKSPAIEYLNTGDTYTPTILYVNGSYRVGSWGDLVERGSYA